MANNISLPDFDSVERVVKTTDNASVHTPHHNVDAIAAGETHLGEVGMSADVVTVTPTVSTSPAYSAGDSIGGKITLTGAIRAAGQAANLDAIVLLDQAGQDVEGTILIFNADPTSATLTDNAAAVLSTDDLKIVAMIPVVAADYVTIDGHSIANLFGLGRLLKAASGTTLYAAFVATSTPTFASTSDLQLKFCFVRG